MNANPVTHFHMTASGSKTEHTHWGGRVFHEHEDKFGYGQTNRALRLNEMKRDKRRRTYYGRSSKSRIDAETAMNPSHYDVIRDGLGRDGDIELIHDKISKTYYFRKPTSRPGVYRESTSYDSAAEARDAFPNWVVWHPLDNPKKYTLIATVVSKSRPGKSYQVKKDEHGNLSCNCPVWIFKKSGKRTCKHVKAMETIMANPGSAWHLKARDEAQQILSGTTDRDRKNYWKGTIDAHQISLNESVKQEVKAKHTRLNNPRKGLRKPRRNK